MQGCRMICFAGIFSVLVVCLLCNEVVAQDVNIPSPHSDTFFLAKKHGWLGKLGQSIATTPPEEGDISATNKGIDPFMPYQGKVIRKITVEEVGFEQAINDTAIIRRTFLTKLGDALHRKTREQVIRNNLFFNTGDSVYPFQLADNSIFLRTLNYLQDARIVLKPTDDSTQVDVIILYKDVFSISGAVEVANANSVYLQGQEDNFMGLGDRLMIQNFYDMYRTPKDAVGAEYVKRNLAGSFLNYTIGYQQLNHSFSNGRREENYLYTRLELPLVSPYHMWTGGIEAAVHYTEDLYGEDSVYDALYHYRYNIFDGWWGYNISGGHLEREKTERSLKQFLALRVFDRDFKEVPGVYKGIYNINYASVKGAVASLTLFKQEYYRTTFLYGFGRNEDVPEGINVAFTGGWISRNDVSRPYAGINYQHTYFTPKKRFYNFTVLAGTYYNRGELQDASVLASLESFTKLRRLGNSNWFLRHFLSGSITQQFNTYLNETLRINSAYGIPQFSNDTTIQASTRITANCESVFYNTWKFLDFRFAPFTFVNLTYLRLTDSEKYDTYRHHLYYGVGGGIRTRNENLVFGTIELRAYYYPRTSTGMAPWNITLTTDLRFKYNSRYIQRPDVVPVN